jgi:hypothetical protein
MKNLIILLILSIALFNVIESKKNRVLLKDITTLTFYKNQYTTGKRSSVPQLKCISNCKDEPSTVQCKNNGFDGVSVQWKCEAEMKKTLSFDRVRVSCEGFSGPGDEYVLAGSCGLEYSLKSSGKRNNRKRRTYRTKNTYVNNSDSGSSFFGTIMTIVIFFVVLFVIIKVCCKSNPSNRTVYEAPRASGVGDVTYVEETIYPRRTVFTTTGSDFYPSTGFYSNSNTTNIYNNDGGSNYSNNNDDDDDSETHTSTGFGDSNSR